MTELTVIFPERWISADKFEQALLRAAPTSFKCNTAITFCIPASGKVMLEAAVRLLSLANQLAAERIAVTLAFEGEQHDAMNWLNRANFFTVLSQQVDVLPYRPDPRDVQQYQGQSKNIVEFKSIGTSYNEEYVQSLPGQLTKALKAVLENYPDSKSLSDVAYLIFGELIRNVYDHSRTELDGFVAMQAYPQGKKVQVVVSDSGIGLLETLRQKVSTHLSDADLLYSLLRGSLNWSKTSGDGLRGCARGALKHQGRVDIRLATCSISLQPSSGSYEREHIRTQSNLALIKGTHICFSFPLDNSP